jgi:hypothetical protein
MSKIHLAGATLYRIGFAVFLTAVLMNAIGSYTTGVQARYTLGLGDAEAMIAEAYAYIGLAFILTLEMVGLIMFKWVKRQVSKVA